MPRIYKNFAHAIAPLNFETDGPHCVSAPGGRGYLRNEDGTENLYIGQVHWRILDEHWIMQENLCTQIAQDETFHGRVYAGCAGKVNLNYMSAIRAPAAILFDINPLQKIFWDGLIDLIAAHPSRDDFAAALPDYVIATYHKLENIFGDDLLRAKIKPPKNNLRNNETSLIRGMKYDDKFSTIQKNSGYSSYCAEWVDNDADYRHIHLMAKHRAIATLTLDIRDNAANTRLAEVLENISYTAGTYDRRGPVNFEKEPSSGTAIGFLYRSNVCHYMRRTQKELEKYRKEHGDEPKDFTKLPVNTRTYSRAFNNVRQWMHPESHMIASDTHDDRYLKGTFVPRLTAVRGFAPV